MKIIKKALALLLCLLMMASGCMLSVSATGSTDSETIYFEVPSDWQNWKQIYCHINIYGGDSLGNWQSKKERCTLVEGNLYAYDTTKVGGLEDGVTYCVIMSADIGMETYSTVLTTECLGDTLYCDGTYYANPIDEGRRSIAAFWSNQDSNEFGPILQITSLGNIIGTCPLEPVSNIFLDFLNYNLNDAQMYSGKTDQQIIDDIITKLGISKTEAAEIIEESGVYVEWFDTSFIKSIEVKPVSFIEGTNGEISCDYNEETHDYDLMYYEYTDFYNIEYTLTFVDGTVISDYGPWFEYNDNSYRINVSTNQSYDNQWKAGNTYDATASALGVSATFPVTIETSPIKNIEINPYSFIVGTGGYMDDYYDEIIDDYAEYYYYSDFYDIEGTITFNDGTVEKINGTWFEYDGYEYDIDISTDQSYENQWKAGNTYEATVTALGVTATFPVTIEKSPVKNIEVKPLSFVVQTNGYFATDYNYETDAYDLEYYRYTDFDDIEYTVTFNDGSSQSGTGNRFEYKGTTFSINIDDYQSYEEPWTEGNTYEATATLLGATTTFPVIIEKSPIKSFSIKPFTLTEGIDSSYVDAGYEDEIVYYHRYNYYDDYISYTIIFNDGTSVSGTGTHVNYKDENYRIDLTDNQSYENPWTPGNTYTIQARFIGATCEPIVTIVEDPITNIDVIKQPNKTVLDKYEHFNPQGAVLRINYNDGTYEDVTLGFYNNITGYNYIHLNRFNKDFRWNFYATHKQNNYMIQLLDFVIDLKATVIDKEITDLAIKENDAQLYMTITYNDSSKSEMKVLGMQGAMGDKDENGKFTEGLIFTDNGTYIGCFYTNISTGEFHVSLGTHTNTVATSNTLKSCMWWSLQEKFEHIANTLEIYAKELKNFDGTIDSTNIDSLLSIACCYQRLFRDKDSIIDEDNYWFTFKALNVKNAFLELFGETPDLSLSNNYDASNNSIKVKEVISKGGEPFEIPFKITSNNGIYSTTIKQGTRIYNMSVDNEFSLVGYNISTNAGGILGDANGDNEVNIKDVTSIQKHIALLTTLSANGVLLADVNDDGNVNIKDATAIQKHIAYLPVEYPIGKPI